MTKPSFFLAALALSIVRSARGATYTCTSVLSGEAFMNAFEWEAIPDPTNGDVNYVDRATAEAGGLYSVTDDSVTLRADDTTVLNGTGRGRNSFRLQSLAQYTTHVAIFDVAHMPEGCGTWPAICAVRFFCLPIIIAAKRHVHVVSSAICRELGANWPNEGEVDIVEGANDQSPNQSTLHTGANCSMPATRWMTGKSLGTDCNIYDTNNAGCGIALADDKSFGPSFNRNGGGWYAIERSATYIAIYFWGRDSLTVPYDVSCPGETVDTSDWGVPAAYFPSTDCNFSTHLGPHNIIINLTFCGSWAGNSTIYAASGCPSTCTEYVNANPTAFRDAYFEFNGLNIYE